MGKNLSPGLRSGPHTWDDLLRVEELKAKYEEERDEIKQNKILKLIKNRIKDYVDWDIRNKSETSFVYSKLSEITRVTAFWQYCHGIVAVGSSNSCAIGALRIRHA
jgi:hypothetical protein